MHKEVSFDFVIATLCGILELCTDEGAHRFCIAQNLDKIERAQSLVIATVFSRVECRL